MLRPERHKIRLGIHKFLGAQVAHVAPKRRENRSKSHMRLGPQVAHVAPKRCETAQALTSASALKWPILFPTNDR